MTDLVADAYATIPVFRLFVRNAGISDATDADTTQELLALESAARAIDRSANRNFATTAVAATARVYTADPRRRITRQPVAQTVWPYQWTVAIDDVADLAGMIVKFDATGDGDYTTTVTAYRAMPTNNPGRGLPYTFLLFDRGTVPPFTAEGVQVTAKWGFGTACPTTIQNANLLQAARFLKRRDAPFGIAGSPELGSELRLLAKLDPDVAVMVSAFRRHWGAA